MEVTVCNVCARVGVPTMSYVIEQDGRSAEVDLCSDDAAPLEALLPAKDTRAKRPRRAATRTPILSMEEIEQRKRKPQTNGSSK